MQLLRNFSYATLTVLAGFTILFLAISHAAVAQIPLSQAVADQGNSSLSVAFIEDLSGSNSVIQASIQFTRMRSSGGLTTNPVIKFENKQAFYWIELPFTNQSKNEDWWFILEPAEASLPSPVKSLALYDPQDPQLKPIATWPGTYQTSLSGAGVPFKLKSGQTKSHYVLVNTWAGIDTALVPYLRSQDFLHKASVSALQKTGLFWLIIGAVFGTGIVQLLLTRQSVQGALALNALIVGASVFIAQRQHLVPNAATLHPVIIPLTLAFMLGAGASLMLWTANLRYKMQSLICLLPLLLNLLVFMLVVTNVDMVIAQLSHIESVPRYLLTATGILLVAITLFQGFVTVNMYWFFPAWVAFISMAWLGGEFPHAIPVIYVLLLCVAGIASIFWQWKTRDKESESLQKRLRMEVKAIKDKFQHENENWRKKMDTQRDMLNELRMREQQRSAELEVARKTADEANEAKSDFLAIISHEIRTPMNGIMGILQILNQTPLDEKQLEYVDVIKNSGDTMLTLLNDILDYSKIEKGAIELEEILFSMRKLVNSIAMLMSGRAKDKGISVQVEIDDAVSDNFYGDPQRVRQILLNLVSNAIKFTEKGSVTIRVTPSGKETSHSRDTSLRFEVIDTGIGISQEAQDKLFQAYVQADSSISRRYGGTGLGLNICKMLVGAMKGELGVKSVEGKGSTFWFEILLRVSQTAPADENKKVVRKHESGATPNYVRTLDILVIDDNPINLKIVASFLEMDGHRVVTAGSGNQALALIEQERFDLIFVDILMPGMNGQTFLRKLRENPSAYHANIPVYALTGMADKKSIDEIMSLGMLGVLLKPITQEALRNTIQKAFSHMSDDEADIGLDDIMAKLDTLSEEEKHALRSALFPDQGGSSMTAASPQNNEPTIPETPPVEDTSSHTAYLNMAILGELKTGLPAETLKEIFDDLIDKAKELTTQIEEASTQSDYADLGEIAHNLKGMAGNFGLQELMDHSGMIEKAVRNDENEKAAALVKDSRRVLDQSLAALERWLAS